MPTLRIAGKGLITHSIRALASIIGVGSSATAIHNGSGSAPKYEIGELAQLSGLSVDTIRFYQSRGILMYPARQGRRAYYGADHLARLADIRTLQERGLSLREIKRRLEEPVAAERLKEDLRLDFEEFSSRIGLPTAIVRSLIAEGLLIPITEGDRQVFGPKDIRMAELALQLLGLGLPFADVLTLAKSHHLRMEATVDEAVALFEETIRVDPATSDEDEIAEEYQTFVRLSAAVAELVALHFERLLFTKSEERFLDTAGTKERETVLRLATERQNQ